MLDPEKTRERELLQRRVPELDQELAQNPARTMGVEKATGIVLTPRKTARLLSARTFEHHFSQQPPVACRQPLRIISTKAVLYITG